MRVAYPDSMTQITNIAVLPRSVPATPAIPGSGFAWRSAEIANPCVTGIARAGGASPYSGMARRPPTATPNPGLRVFQSAGDPGWFAITKDFSALPAALAPWFPADGHEIPRSAAPLEQERIEKVISVQGFYLFRLQHR